LDWHRTAVKGIVWDMARAARKRPRPLHEVLKLSPPPALHQDRSRRSYQALVDAATELFATQGYDAVGIPDITSAAGLAVGSFYRYFEGKHEAYLDIIRKAMNEAYDATMAGLTPQRFVGRAGRATIAKSVRVLFDHVLRRPGLSRSLVEMSLRDAECAEIRRAFEAASMARLTELVAAVCPRSAVADPAAAAFVLYGAAMHCAYGLAGHVGSPPVDAKRAEAALVDFLVRGLRLD
jgi:AcrR family transcriptional regulator